MITNNDNNKSYKSYKNIDNKTTTELTLRQEEEEREWTLKQVN